MSRSLSHPVSRNPEPEKVTARSHLGFLAFTTLCFFAASSTPTPLYHLYQEAWGFSSGVLTLIFAVYAFSLLAALLMGGSLSDYLGRRPVIFGALLLQIVSMLLFIFARDVTWLVARVCYKALRQALRPVPWGLRCWTATKPKAL